MGVDVIKLATAPAELSQGNKVGDTRVCFYVWHCLAWPAPAPLHQHGYLLYFE
jgi:hypothetical protein